MQGSPPFDPPEYVNWKPDAALVKAYRATIEADSERAAVVSAVSPDAKLALYAGLLRARLHDIQLQRWVRTGVISKAWLGSGEEGSTVGPVHALERGSDVVAPMIRNAAACCELGMPIADMLRAYLATDDSPSRGRDLHVGAWTHGVLQPISHVGDMVPVVTGVALTFKMRGERRIALTWVGDGSTKTAAAHEATNFAAVQRVPAIFILQNNQVALGTRLDQHHLPGDFREWPAQYGVWGARFDGNNVLDAYAATRLAAARCRDGQGPAMLVAETFRMGGHATHDEREARETLLGCRAAPGAQSSSPPAGQDTVLIAGHVLYVQSGFHVNLFAGGLGGVRSLALGPGGAVFATLSGSGMIVRLVDVNGDGVADAQAQTVLSGLDYPFGLAFRRDTMYLSEQTSVKRLDPGAAAPVTLVSNLPSGGHVTRTIAFGPDNLLYVAVGSSCNVCNDAPPRAAVTHYRLDGSSPHTFATGLRNSVGLAFHPTTGELWANNNDRDYLGDNLPPEHLNILKDGKWYGWPQCYLPGKPNPEYPGFDCSGVEPPAITDTAHSAPLGLAFYTGTMFPAAYQGDAFMTYHGSWNRSVPTGAKVVRVRVQSGRPTAIEDFVTGWQLAGGSRWGRPVGPRAIPDGALHAGA